MGDKGVKLALPSKGRLMENALAWLETQCGIKIMREQNMRAYSAYAEGRQDVRPIFMAASEIPVALLDGRVDFGMTGMDMVQEKIPNWEARIEKVGVLGFGHADLIVAVPAFWQDVGTVHDLDAVAADFRARWGFRLRIATKYPHLACQFLKARGVADYQLVESQGATEGTVRHNIAEAIIDISSTGQTLVQNGLKKLSDGVILQSQAGLFARRGKDMETAALGAFRAEVQKALEAGGEGL